MSDDLNICPPLARDHPMVGERCPACDEAFKPGDIVALINLGPGADREQRAKARAGKPYTGVAAAVHRACADGVEDS